MFSFILLTFIIGICVGSFLNVCIYRIPKRESIVFGSSHCMACQTPIKSYDLIPIFSYIFLRGKCRTCGCRLSMRYPSIELLNGILYVIIFLTFGISIQTLVAFIFLSTLLVLAMIDIDTMEVPNGLVLFIVILGVISLIITHDISIKHALLGFLAGGLPLLLIAILSKGGMGGGDIKLMAACGILLGPVNILLALFFASIVALIFCIPLLVGKKKGMKDALPFVPFLTIGIGTAYLFSSFIISFYLELFI